MKTDLSRIRWMAEAPRGSGLIAPVLTFLAKRTDCLWFWYRNGAGHWRLWFGKLERPVSLSKDDPLRYFDSPQRLIDDAAIRAKAARAGPSSGSRR